MKSGLYWIAINGSSCAICCYSPRWPFRVTPTPEVLVGFPTVEEAQKAQHSLLNDSLPVIAALMNSWHHRSDLTIMRPRKPDPQTHGDTFWEEL